MGSEYIAPTAQVDWPALWRGELEPETLPSHLYLAQLLVTENWFTDERVNYFVTAGEVKYKTSADSENVHVATLAWSLRKVDTHILAQGFRLVEGPSIQHSLCAPPNPKGARTLLKILGGIASNCVSKHILPDTGSKIFFAQDLNSIYLIEEALAQKRALGESSIMFG